MPPKVSLTKVEHDRLKKEAAKVPNLESQIVLKDGEIGRLKGSNTNIARDRDTFKGESEQAAKDLRNANDKLRSVGEERDKLKANNTGFSLENASLKTLKAELERLNGDLKEEVENLTEQVRSGATATTDLAHVSPAGSPTAAADPAVLADQRQQIFNLNADLTKYKKLVGLLEKSLVIASLSKKERYEAVGEDWQIRIKAIVLDVLTRNWSFIETIEESQEATKKVYAELSADERDIYPESSFVAKFMIVVEYEMQSWRQNVQEKLKDRAKGTYKLLHCFSYSRLFVTNYIFYLSNYPLFMSRMVGQAREDPDRGPNQDNAQYGEQCDHEGR